MEKITAIDEVNCLIRPYFTPKVVTNNFLSSSVYERLIQHDALSYFQYRGALFFVVRKENFDLLYFHLPAEAKFNFLELADFFTRDMVSECVFRPHAAYKDQIKTKFLDGGFETIASRHRVVKTDDFPAAEARQNHFAMKWITEEEVSAAIHFMKHNFDLYYGCVPFVEDLAAEAKNANVLCAFDAANIAALLRAEPKKNTFEIKHIAVGEKYRGSGLASNLFAEACRRLKPKKVCAWVVDGNQSAKVFYAKNGFQEDQWTSSVFKLIRKK